MTMHSVWHFMAEQSLKRPASSWMPRMPPTTEAQELCRGERRSSCWSSSPHWALTYCCLMLTRFGEFILHITYWVFLVQSASKKSAPAAKIPVFWCRMRDPIPYVQRFPEADILFASDNLVRAYVGCWVAFSYCRNRDLTMSMLGTTCSSQACMDRQPISVLSWASMHWLLDMI